MPIIHDEELIESYKAINEKLSMRIYELSDDAVAMRERNRRLQEDYRVIKRQVGILESKLEKQSHKKMRLHRKPKRGYPQYVNT